MMNNKIKEMQKHGQWIFQLIILLITKRQNNKLSSQKAHWLTYLSKKDHNQHLGFLPVGMTMKVKLKCIRRNRPKSNYLSKESR